MSALDVVPSVLVMASRERLPVTFDFANVLTDGDLIQSVTAELVNRRTGLSYPDALENDPFTDSHATKATQWIAHPQADQNYRLILVARTMGGREWAPELQIQVQY